MSVMRLTCEQCGKYFDVPEEKLPGQGRFRFTCPGCKGKNIVQLPEKGDQGEAGTDRDPACPEDDMSQAAEPDMFPPGAEVAFVRVQDQDWWERIESYLLSTGFYLSTADNVNEAVHKLRLNSYQCVILEEGAEHEELLNEIACWPGQIRREVNVILVGSQAPSFDPGQAFVQGVNTYLSLSDLDSAEQYLDQARGEFDQVKEPWSAVREEGSQA